MSIPTKKRQKRLLENNLRLLTFYFRKYRIIMFKGIDGAQ